MIKYLRELIAGKLFITALKIATPELIVAWRMALNGDDIKTIKAVFAKAIKER